MPQNHGHWVKCGRKEQPYQNQYNFQSLLSTHGVLLLSERMRIEYMIGQPVRTVPSARFRDSYGFSAVESITKMRPGGAACTLFLSRASLTRRRNSRLTPYCLLGRVLIRTRYSASPLPTRSIPATCTSLTISS